MLPVYATVAELKAYATQYQRSDELRHEIIIPPASRMIDGLCGVPDGYFGVWSEAPTERCFAGTGIRHLRVDPYRPGSIQFVEYAFLDDYTPEYTERKDTNGTQWLIAEPGCVWSSADDVRVTACWGFEEVPAEIVQATIELALVMWRQRDPALTKLQTDVNGQLIVEAAIPKRARETCAEWRKRRKVVFA